MNILKKIVSFLFGQKKVLTAQESYKYTKLKHSSFHLLAKKLWIKPVLTKGKNRYYDIKHLDLIIKFRKYAKRKPM